jgi:hypothetical protein
MMNSFWGSDEKSERVWLASCKEFEKGEQVLMPYGRKGNKGLLVNYGFTLLENEWDVLEVADVR